MTPALSVHDLVRPAAAVDGVSLETGATLSVLARGTVQGT